MLIFIGFVAFVGALVSWYDAARLFRFKRNGIQSTAVVREIEKTVEKDEDGLDVIRYWLHLDLPDYHGVKLGKKYEKPISPARYRIGEELAIIQIKEAPTELIIEKEQSIFDKPGSRLILGILLILLAYASCNILPIKN